MAAHAYCDDKFCIKQASEKRTVKGKDEIVFKKGRKFVCNIPVDYWAKALNKRVNAKNDEVSEVKADIQSIESSCVARYGMGGGALESLDTLSHRGYWHYPSVSNTAFLNPATRLSGKTYVNVDLEECLSERNKYYPSLLKLVHEEVKLEDEVRRYNDNLFWAKLDEIDLPTVQRKKVKVIVNPKTRKSEYPRVELGRQKLKIFRDTLPDLPQCSKKIG